MTAALLADSANEVTATENPGSQTLEVPTHLLHYRKCSLSLGFSKNAQGCGHVPEVPVARSPRVEQLKLSHAA